MKERDFKSERERERERDYLMIYLVTSSTLKLCLGEKRCRTILNHYYYYYGFCLARVRVKYLNEAER